MNGWFWLGGLVLLGVGLGYLWWEGWHLRDKRARLDKAFQALDLHLKRRWELLPVLVQMVQEGASEKRATLEKILLARNAARDARGRSAERFRQEGLISKGLEELYVIAEASSEVSKLDQFQILKGRLAEVERQLAVQREVYHEVGEEWNRYLASPKGSVVKQIFDFREAEKFEGDRPEREREVLSAC